MTERPYDLEAPLLLLGRGGGGTRLLSELARSCGVHLGARISVSGDSQDWVETLYALALEEVARGLAPGPSDLAWTGRLRRRAAEVLADAPSATPAGWGWKLPETMLALRPVLRAFPGARPVHLVRHPLTMALRRSHLTSRMDNPVGRAVLPAAYRHVGRDPGRIDGDPVWLHNAASWTYQVGHVLACRAEQPERRWLQLSYEELCADLAAVASRLAAFAGSASPGEALIDPARTGPPVVLDAVSEAIWSLCGPVAGRLGYAYEDPFCLASFPIPGDLASGPERAPGGAAEPA